MKVVNVGRIILSKVLERKPAFGSYTVISGSERWYNYVDLSDQRGRSLVLSGLSQPQLSRIWEDAVCSFSPDVVIDVGANYGEFGLGVRYKKISKILLVEANPRLCRYLKKSMALHPESDRIELVSVMACGPEMCGEEMDLFIDSRWSGYSSAIVPQDHQNRGVLVGCPCETIDSILGNDNHGKLMFKIDVEGYEGQVLSGMANTLNKSNSIFGMIEFNRECLIAADCDPEQLINNLQCSGSTYRVASGRGPRLIKVDQAEDIPQGKQDIIVCNDRVLIERINEMGS